MLLWPVGNRCKRLAKLINYLQASNTFLYVLVCPGAAIEVRSFSFKKLLPSGYSTQGRRVVRQSYCGGYFRSDLFFLIRPKSPRFSSRASRSTTLGSNQSPSIHTVSAGTNIDFSLRIRQSRRTLFFKEGFDTDIAPSVPPVLSSIFRSYEQQRCLHRRRNQQPLLQSSSDMR